ncbi:MAG: hypothetical protein JJ863_09540 [Deltaproteobacteria bacterium]|nr:hypothetical protein [Deltaproteobacteria bacterium]
MGRAKGSNMHYMRSFVLQRWGADAMERVLAELEPHEAAEVRALVPMTWHDLALQHRLLRTIDRVLGDGDGSLVPAIGRYEADRDLKIVIRLVLRLANPAFVLEKAGEYWRRFYDQGRWEVTRHSPTRATGVLSGVAPFDPFFALYLHAYVHRLFELVGARDLKTTYSLDESVDPPVLRIDGEWR